MSSSLSAIQLKKTQAPAAAVENETSPVPQMLNDGPNPDQTCSEVKVLSNTSSIVLSNTSSMLTCMWRSITKVDQCLCGFILAVKGQVTSHTLAVKGQVTSHTLH